MIYSVLVNQYIDNRLKSVYYTQYKPLNTFKGNNMKDFLLDLVQYATVTSTFDSVRIDSTDEGVEVTAHETTQEPRFILEGRYDANFFGENATFGMPNLSKLKIILGFDEYDEHAKIGLSHQKSDGGNDVVSGIEFNTGNDDFNNRYRFMAKALIEEKYRKVLMKIKPTFTVEFEPSVNGIVRMKKQFQVLSDQEHFMIKLENGNLNVYIGDPSTQNANFTFQTNVSGTLSKNWLYPSKLFLPILDLPGDKKIRLSAEGLAEIHIDSGLSKWVYKIPALSK